MSTLKVLVLMCLFIHSSAGCQYFPRVNIHGLGNVPLRYGNGEGPIPAVSDHWHTYAGLYGE